MPNASGGNNDVDDLKDLCELLGKNVNDFFAVINMCIPLHSLYRI